MRCKVSEDMSEAQLWAVMQSLSGRTFMTAKGLQFTVTLAGNELFVSRKRKSITRATVWRAYMRLLELQARGEVVDGPKKLGTFGGQLSVCNFHCHRRATNVNAGSDGSIQWQYAWMQRNGYASSIAKRCQ